ncbi:MAG: hypothetical protein ACXAE3_16325, partial [Candidatus Kariarchaeaceae archaeon]
GLQVGYDIGDELDLTLVTSNDPGGWLNLTILVEDDTGSTLTYDGEDYDLGYTFDTIDIEGLEGERNIYAIVVVSGLAFDFLAVGWLFDGILTISPTIPPGPGTAEVTDVSDIGLFDGAETSVSYALLNEPLNYSVNLVDTDNQPVADHEIGVYILTPDDIDGLDEQFFLNNDADTTLTTDVNGDGIFSFAFNDIDYIIGEYYAILGYAGGLVYEEHIVHITGDITFNYTITNQITLDDRLIDLGEETQYIIDLDTVVTDEEIALLTIALGGSVDGRTLFSGYSFLSYNIVTKDAHDTNLLNPIGYRAVLGSCGTDLTAINQDCYRLSTYSAVDGFGIVDSDFSDGQIVINMTGGVVSLNSYYLVIFDTDTQEYYVNVDQRFLFTSDPVVPLNLGGFLIDYPSQDVHQNSESNVSVTYCPILLATFPMLKRIKKEVRL